MLTSAYIETATRHLIIIIRYWILFMVIFTATCKYLQEKTQSSINKYNQWSHKRKMLQAKVYTIQTYKRRLDKRTQNIPLPYRGRPTVFYTKFLRTVSVPLQKQTAVHIPCKWKRCMPCSLDESEQYFTNNVSSETCYLEIRLIHLKI